MLRTVVSKSVINPCRIILNSTRNSQNQNLRFVRWRSHLPFNTAILFVPQQEAWVVERMGKYHRILDPGVNFLIPVIDSVKYVQSLKEITIDIPKQAAITLDNVNLNIDGVSEIGKISLDYVFRERESLNVEIVRAINKASEAWGITCLRYEIRDMKLPQRIQDAMQMQVEAERQKRATILESEGVREAEINVAEGKRKATILASEAQKLEQINVAEGKAEALLILSNALSHKQGLNAASLSTAVNYIDAFEKLASKNNTMILPANVADISGVVGSALSIYKNLSNAIDRNATLLTQSDAEETEEPTVEGVRRQVEASSKEISSDPQPILKPEDKY
ncbi:Stomatin-like protein 2, mitochondrial [Armadillidium vulgare]|nr:Stomatin-like protein 2, mitochondrial [Armadillidium vulgare]